MVTRVGNDIFFDDLGAPEYSRLQKLVISLGKHNKVEFSEANILNDARQATGLDDFGPDHFKTPLNILIDEYDNDPFISPIGRAQVYNDLVRCAANRLIIQDRINKTPQLSSTPLTRPLSVSGLPRSGTTHLVNLLAADSRFQNLPLWVAQEPFCAPGQNKSGLGLKLRAKFLNRLLKNGDSRTDDPRFYRCSLRWSGMKIMGPELASMHPMNPDHVHEELELMTFDFGCNQFEWTSVTPNYRDHYYATDQTPHYGYMKNVLKLLQLERGDVRPWVLKCVQNPEQLPALNAVFPDSVAILTHRDPVAVIQSTATMLAWGHRMLRTEVSPRDVLDYWTDKFEKMLKACVRDRHVIPKSRSLDVLFHEFMAGDMETVANIYNLYGLELTRKAKGEIADFIKAQPRGKNGRVRYKLKEHFGISASEIRERFDFYFKAFPVKIEVPD